jgi:glycerophosphoryl diester phosphodiesterase
MTHIITHRGLDPDRGTPHGEGTLQAFQDHLARGFGIEFDIRYTKDNIAVALHDKTVARITQGKETRQVKECTYAELCNSAHIVSIETLLDLLATYQNNPFSALHVKGDVQEKEHLNMLIDLICHRNLENLILFDIRKEGAEYIKNALPNVKVYASVSHPYDIERFGTSVGDTLLSLQEVVRYREYFDGVWLDEWDLLDANNAEKKLYTEETFDVLREYGLGSVIVSPELHSSSPGLLGGECHPDGVDRTRLTERVEDILVLSPDAICTDYPDHVRDLSQKQRKSVYSKQ